MKDLNKRLVEVEAVLERLEDKYKKKIPLEIWEYIKKNKDTTYDFYFDDNKPLENQKLNIDTIAMLTYINMEYLLDEEQKKEMLRLLREDEAFAEEKKKEQYKTEDLFRNRKDNQRAIDGNTNNEKAMTKYKESFFKKIINKIKKLFSR
ncbi:MAG: hypothetical protein IJJ82_07860 [Clostridia bacterium]|nr:hypothetical protein [Clostridia bacterium]